LAFPPFDASSYSAIEILRSGQRVLVRALKPADAVDFVAAAATLSAQSLRRRFFGEKRHFTEFEQTFFLNADFIGHVALIAIIEEAGQAVIAGGARYILVKPGQAELAFAVADKYQGQGIGAALLHHLSSIARKSGLKELIAEVLPENIAMLKVLERSGLRHCKKLESGAIHVALQLD
jgi:RimJ/RimL family protein N-acetyltransferase